MESSGAASRIDDLVDAVRVALPVDAAALAALPDSELLELARSAERLGAVVDAARVLAAGQIAARSTPGAEGLNGRLGCRTAGEVVERVTRVSGQTARARIRSASSLSAEWSLCGELLPGAFPALRHAVEAGEVGVDAASAIVAALAPLRERGIGVDQLAAAESALVDAAAEVSADEVRVMAQAWVLFLDPDGALPDESAHRRRELAIGRVRDGLVRVGGSLLPEVAAQLQRLLDAHNNPKVSDGPVFADEADLVADTDHRTAGQKRHDAFAAILQAAAGAAATPQLGGAAPTLIVTVAVDQLDESGGVAFVSDGEGEQPVSADVARHVGCAGAVQRLVFDSAGRLIDLGAPQRIFTPHQRRAIATRDGECIIPGCRVPASWCEVHHVREHARGGPTHTDNGVLLCWHHHRTIESGGWQIEMREGVPFVRAPGWVDAQRPWRPAAGTTRHRFDRMRT